MKYLFPLFAAFLFVNGLHAQKIELGLVGGISTYSGDLAPNEFGVYFEEIGQAYGFFGRFGFSKHLSARLGASYAQISGDDALSVNAGRMLNFRSDIFELALTGELTFFYLGGRDESASLSPYLFGGVALYHFNPEAKLDGSWIELQPLGTEGQGLPTYDPPYQLTQVGFPVGIGLKLIANPKFTIGLEFGGRKLLTDHLDDVSNAEVDYYELEAGNGPLAARLSNPSFETKDDPNPIYRRGGPFKDWYYIGGLTLSFTLGGDYLAGSGGGGKGKNIGCPTF